jgi:histone acetyltransferase (RNA polymerase elongator complex component)
MPRWAGTTTQRGLGGDHQALRRQKLAALVDGTPCRRCGHPMIHPKRCKQGRCFFCLLDLGHYEARVHGGRGPRELEHRWCNRSAGTRLLNRMKAARRRQHTRQW